MTSGKPNHNSRRIKNALKIFFVGVLFWFLYRKGYISGPHTREAFTEHLGIVAPPLAILISLAGFGAIRWQWLLRAQGIELPWLKTFQLTFIGNFFNIALPGAVSGDFVKAFYVASVVQTQRSRAFGSILFDRIVGLSALVLVSAGALLADISVLRGSPLLQAIQTLLLAGAVCVVIFYGYLFMMPESRDPMLGILRRLEGRLKVAGSLTRIYEGVRHYHHHRATVARALALSVVIHLLVAFSCIRLLHALEPLPIASLPVFVVVPLGLLVTAVPIAPAGIGTGHFAFSKFFELLGTARGGDLYTLYAIAQLLIGGLGGLVYLRFKSHSPALDLATTD